MTSKTVERYYTQELPVSPGCHIVSLAVIGAGVNNYSVTQLNDVKLNPACKISPLAGTRMSAQAMYHKNMPGTLQLPWVALTGM